MLSQVKELLKDAKVSTADKKLCAAREAIHKALLTGLKMNAAGDALDEGGAPPQVASFNAALTALRAAMGSGWTITLKLQPAGAPGKQGVRARLTRPKFSKPDSDAYTLLPVTLLDIASTSKAKAIFAAEETVAKTAAVFAKALADCPAGSYLLGLKKRKITVNFPKPGAKVKAKAPNPKPPKQVHTSEDGELEEEEPGEEEEVEEGEVEEGGEAVAEATEDDDTEKKEDGESCGDDCTLCTLSAAIIVLSNISQVCCLVHPQHPTWCLCVVFAEGENESGTKTTGKALSAAQRKALAATQEKQSALKRAASSLNSQVCVCVLVCSTESGGQYVNTSVFAHVYQPTITRCVSVVAWLLPVPCIQDTFLAAIDYCSALHSMLYVRCQQPTRMRLPPAPVRLSLPAGVQAHQSVRQCQRQYHPGS